MKEKVKPAENQTRHEWDRPEVQLLAHFQYGANEVTTDRKRIRGITKRVLTREGFKEIWQHTFSRTFSGVLELRITTHALLLTPTYEWRMIGPKFCEMILRLGKLRTDLELRASTVYRFSYGRKSLSEPSEQFSKEMDEALPQVRLMLDRFRDNYADFLDLLHAAKPPKPYPMDCTFFFSACKSKAQLKRFFEFIELYLDVFVGFRHHKRHVAKTQEPFWGIALLVYHRTRMQIEAVRKVHRMGRSLEELKLRFSKMDEGLLEKSIRKHRETGRYALKPSDLAYSAAAPWARTTPKNLRKEFRKRPDLFSETKAHRLAFPGNDRGAPVDLIRAHIGGIPRRDWIEWIRWVLVQRCNS